MVLEGSVASGAAERSKMALTGLPVMTSQVGLDGSRIQ